jgi:hypothetical protein
LGQGVWAGALWLGLRALPTRWPPQQLVQLGSLGLASLGLYWTWERALGLFSR